MEKILFSDPLLEIIQYMSPKDVLNIINSSIECKKIIKYYHFHQIILKEINRRLKLIFKDYYDEFKKQLQDNQAIISGSFILQCILGEDWEDSDVDIYVPIRNSQSKYTYLEDFLYRHLAQIEYHCREYNNNNIEGTRKYACYNEKYFNKVKCSVNPNTLYRFFSNSYNCIEPNTRHIQIIRLNCTSIEEIKKFILNDFDFDIVKNSYYIKDDIEYLTIYNLKDVLSKTTLFKVSQTYLPELNRKKKYEHRGFKFFYDLYPQ